jgi:hypothetical protein
MKKGGADLIRSTTTFPVTRGHGARHACMLDAASIRRRSMRPIDAPDQRAMTRAISSTLFE